MPFVRRTQSNLNQEWKFPAVRPATKIGPCRTRSGPNIRGSIAVLKQLESNRYEQPQLQVRRK